MLASTQDDEIQLKLRRTTARLVAVANMPYWLGNVGHSCHPDHHAPLQGFECHASPLRTMTSGYGWDPKMPHLLCTVPIV